jgi:uncharacterized membrane protein YidH (DUF202 family)
MTKREIRQQEYEQNIFDNWHTKRDAGKKNFIIKFGVLSWGLSTFGVYWILVFFMEKFTGNDQLLNLGQLLYTLIFFAAFGAVYGWMLWNRNEKIFKKKFPYGRTK